MVGPFLQTTLPISIKIGSKTRHFRLEILSFSTGEGHILQQKYERNIMITGQNQEQIIYYLCNISTHCEQGQKVKIVIGDGISEDRIPDTGSASSLVTGALSLLLSTLVFQFLALCCAY